MRDDSSVTVTLSELNRTESLGKRTDLVNLNKNRVSATLFDTALEVFNVGHEQVVTYELATVADKVSEDFPVILAHTILDRIDGELLNELLEVLSLLL